MSDPVVWELSAGARTFAHVRWIRAREIAADAPWPVPLAVEAWWSAHVAGRQEEAIGPGEMARFMEGLPRRLAGVAARLGPAVQLAPRAAWLDALDDDRIPPLGVRDPFGWSSNRWAPEFDVDWLLHETERGSVRWSRGARRGFKAGGRCPDATEMWCTVAACGPDVVLALRHRRRMWGAPVRQRTGWLVKAPLQRLLGLLEARC